MSIRVNDKSGHTPLPNYARQKWEYLSRTMEIGADLLQYGEEGWELVSVVPIPHDPSQALFCFKRRRS